MRLRVKIDNNTYRFTLKELISERPVQVIKEVIIPHLRSGAIAEVFMGYKSDDKSGISMDCYASFPSE